MTEQAGMIENVTVIGFDLGHGDTAIASTRLATTDEPRILSVNGLRTIPTIVGRHQDNRIVFGEIAGRNATELVEAYERFKSPDFEANGGAAKATQMFVSAVFSTLQDDKQIDDIGRTHVFVGHPSGWPAHAVEEYRSLLLRSGLALVDVVPESRAAFIHARESGELNLSMDELSRNVLIMDFGSSTTDFTATSGLTAQPLDFGHVSLGAGLIDGLIMNRMIGLSRDRAELMAALRRLPGKRAELAHKCRMAKERYFNAEKRDAAPLIEDIVKIDTGLSVDIELDRDRMEDVLTEPCDPLEGMSWRQALQACLAQALRQVADPDLIILTGGAARMGFVRDSVTTVFPQAKIAMSQEPEFAIAKGLALYGRQVLKTKAFQTGVDTLIQGAAFKKILDDGLPSLISLQAAAVAKSLAEGPVRSAILRWRDEPTVVSTIDEMGSLIIRDCQAWVQSPAAKGVISGVVTDWLETVRIQLEMLTDPVCERFGIAKRALSLKGQTILPMSGGVFGTPDVIGDVSVVQAIASVISTLIVAKLLLAFHLLLASHPIGWATAMVGTVAGAVIGVDEAKRLLKGTHIPGMVRGFLISDGKITKLVEEASRTIRKQLEQQLQTNETAASDGERLSDKLHEHIGRAIRHRADDAILLLR